MLRLIDRQVGISEARPSSAVVVRHTQKRVVTSALSAYESRHRVYCLFSFFTLQPILIYAISIGIATIIFISRVKITSKGGSIFSSFFQKAYFISRVKCSNFIPEYLKSFADSKIFSSNFLRNIASELGNVIPP